MKGEILFACIVLLILSGTYLGVVYSSYKQEVKECCEGYRKYVLQGQEGGECGYWSFMNHLGGIRGCSVIKQEAKG